MELKKEFGINVRQHRRGLGMTQERLAELVNVSVETIGKIERGIAAPSFATVEEIAKALDVQPMTLFGSGDASTPRGHRGAVLGRIHSTLAAMNDQQLERAANILDAYLGH